MENVVTVQWKDPGTGWSKRFDWDAIAAELRAHPGEWALVGTSAASHAVGVKTGKVKALRPVGAFDACTRKNADGGRDLYVRYVGAS